MTKTQHTFSEIPRTNIPRSLFKRPFNLKTTLGTDYLYPVFVDEVLPSDTVKVHATFFARLNTPLVPIMDNMYLDVFFFAVPLRLVDENFAKVMGDKPFGDVTTDYSCPKLSLGLTGVVSGSLSDYLGIPLGCKSVEINPYFHRAYNLIYNEWFRDENLCVPRPIAGKHYDGTVSPESISDYVLCKRGKRHDYFTSCLPWRQKGDPVSIGLTGLAPVVGNGNALGFETSSTNTRYAAGNIAQGGTGTYLAFGSSPNAVPASGDSYAGSFSNYAYGQFLGVSVSPEKSGLVANLGLVSAIDIDTLRQAVAIESLLQLDARGGTRLIELIRAHFGVVSPDARMQRPEYLGGFSQMLNITSVPQTSASTDDGTPQGNLSAFVTVNSDCRFIKSFTEHCVILGLANIRADLSYSQGLPKMFTRFTRYDYYWPALANLGEQAVLNQEIYCQAANVLDSDNKPANEGVFGYQERWAEYRYHPSMITGLFRPAATGTLAYWHLSQKFASLPQLNSEFIQENVPIDRVVAVTDQPPLMLDAFYDCEYARPMPLYSVPSFGRL